MKTRAQRLIEEMDSNPGADERGTRTRHLVQYQQHGNSSVATVKTKPKLESGLYSISTDMAGQAIFTIVEQMTDELLRFPDERYDLVIEELRKFWESEPKYKALGFTHTRGLGLYGPPGSGKTMLLNLVIEAIIKSGDVVFTTRSPYELGACLKQFREVEPDRQVAVRLEDFDGMMYDEDRLLNLLDGDSKVNRVLYLATTNHKDRLSERIQRPGRFDRWVEIGHPPAAGRKAYLNGKIGHLVEDDVVAGFVEQTDGLSFGALRELLVSVYCLDNDAATTIKRLRDHQRLGPAKSAVDGWSEGKLLAKVQEAFDRKARKPRLTEAAPSRARRFLEADSRADVDKSVPYEPNAGAKPADGAGSSASQATATATSYLPIQPENVKAALTKKLGQFGMDGVMVDDVDVEMDGIITVYFSDTEGGELAVSFTYDDVEGACATVLDDYGDAEDAIYVDLDTLAPPLVKSDFGSYVNMAELSWLNRTTLATILGAGAIGGDLVQTNRQSGTGSASTDAFGNVQPKPEDWVKKTITVDNEVVETSYKVAVRGGKKARIPVLRKKKVKALTNSARMAIHRARPAAEGKTRVRSLQWEAVADEMAPLAALNAAAMAAVRMVNQSSVSIFTAIADVAAKKGLPEEEISAQVLKLYPEYKGSLGLAKKK